MPESNTAAKNSLPSGGDQSDQRLWPVATVMGAGVFATTFVQLQTMGYLPFCHILTKDMGLDSSRSATFMSLAMLPWTFKIVAGLLVDSVPLFGSRRRSYLMLSACVAMLMWLVMGLVPNNYNVLLLLAMGMNTALVFGSTASGGLLVEAGQRFGVSGRLSSVRVFAQNLGAGLSLPVGGLLATYALWYSSLAAILPLAGMFFAAWFLLKPEPLLVTVAHGRSFVQQIGYVSASIVRQIKNVFCWQMLLPAALLFFLQAVPTFRSTSFYEYQTGTLHYSDAAMGWLGLAGYGIALLSSWVYAWWCRRSTLRTSLYLAILVTALSALPYLFYTAYTPYMLRAFAIEGVGTFLQYLAYLPLFDLAVRATPKGSEALGYSLLIGVWNIGLMIGCKTGPMLYEHTFHKNMASLIWLNASVTLAGGLIIAVLPKNLIQNREGK
ncbi:MAG TPA: MFS transporter [Verrucomicrobiae bacterium]|jgi:MFS family permease